jgi:MFS family permease
MAAAAALIGLLMSLGIKERKDITRKPESLKSLLSLFGHRTLMIVSGMAILSQLVTFATVYGFTPIIAKNLGANSFQLGMLTMISTLPAIIASYLSGIFFLRRFGGKTSLAISFALTAVCAAAIPFVPNLTILFVTQFAGGFGRGIIMPLLMAASISGFDEGKRATAMGFFQAIYAIGIFVGPIIVGFFGLGMAGLTAGFLTAAAFALAGAAASLIFISKAKDIVTV